MNYQLKARDEALARCEPDGFEDISPIERLAYVFGFLDGWQAGLDEQQREIDRLQAENTQLRAEIKRLSEKVERERKY